LMEASLFVIKTPLRTGARQGSCHLIYAAND
jgi:hypothetical protein